jgi:predicted MFS family arabinose efflux permease
VGTSDAAGPDEHALPLSHSSPQTPALVAPDPTPERPPRSERILVFLVGAVQFVNVLDFVMVMPLGPDLAEPLRFPVADVGLVGASYTAAAGVAGLFGALFLDRFDRRKALAVAMFGLVVGTAAGGFAWDLPSLLAARVVAGLFGGPATSISLSIIADAVPAARRGKAMGAVMGAFSVAGVLGIPVGLELARLGGWSTPFFAVAGLGVVIASAAIFLMPPMRTHLEGGAPLRHPMDFVRDLLALIADPAAIVCFAGTALITVSVFGVIPNLSAYVQHNLHYPREHLGLLYLVGGAVSFFAMRLAGMLVDKVGAPFVIGIGTVVFAATLFVFFITPLPLPVISMFVLFMVAGSARGVPFQTLASRVPAPQRRASFMSASSAVQHLSSALGAFAASLILVERPDKTLAHMNLVAIASLVLALPIPLLLWFVESRVRAREAAPVR